MIVWSGWGFLVPLIWLALAGVFTVFIKDIVPKPLDSSLLLIICAVIYWFLGMYLEGKSTKEYIDLSTNQRVRIGRRDSFFFIQFKYWAFIAGAFALYIMFMVKKE